MYQCFIKKYTIKFPRQNVKDLIARGMRREDAPLSASLIWINDNNIKPLESVEFHSQCEMFRYAADEQLVSSIVMYRTECAATVYIPCVYDTDVGCVVCQYKLPWNTYAMPELALERSRINWGCQ